MPKMKTNKGVAKRIKITGTGKLMYRKAGKRHLMGSKSSKRTRHMRRPGIIAGVEAQRLRRLLPYGVP
ncbi:MAG: 50S ribosomal protein L35 [Candidatus Omnitrophica bacterium]|nr:50S ribosomal protein L35 [Candidatus Omnitrophota bacterium]